MLQRAGWRSIAAIMLLVAVALIGAAALGLSYADGEEPPTDIPSGSAPADSGIEGEVIISPTCAEPVQPGTTCQNPFQVAVTVLDQQGRSVIRFQPDAEGRFRISLAPGTYSLFLELPAPSPYPDEQPVTVVPGQFTLVRIRYDWPLPLGRTPALHETRSPGPL